MFARSAATEGIVSKCAAANGNDANGCATHCDAAKCEPTSCNVSYGDDAMRTTSYLVLLRIRSDGNVDKRQAAE